MINNLNLENIKVVIFDYDGTLAIHRDKDFVKCILKSKPTYLGETIPVSGNGDVTNDKKEI